MTKNRHNIILRLLVVLNILALTFWGIERLYSLRKLNEEKHKQIVTAAVIYSNAGAMDIGDATKLMQISRAAGDNETLSDEDVHFCLALAKDVSGVSYNTASFRRNTVFSVLRFGIMHDALTPSQREKVAQAVIDALPLDNPHNESGSDVNNVALTMADLKDRRALSILRPYVNDPRRAVQRTVRASIAKLEGAAK